VINLSKVALGTKTHIVRGVFGQMFTKNAKDDFENLKNIWTC
jgi:hypothetical protein